ncbi:type IV pilin protein [Dyella jiangningensis]|uniref:type IV pilin protein n=1 Tax=Dyella jiangningensis TaxID=1379159 RepID=UPI0024103CC0|nr:type IV pilin protein [Dyella jiangningensis]MDG2540076.1 type IV pilin protein [Dyella jiangningensis]
MGRGHWRRSVSPTQGLRAPHSAKASGFTLIELMIVVVIVAILAAIAIPSYRRYVLHGNREAAESLMLEIASAQERYLVDNRSYAPDTSSLGYASSVQPPAVASNYKITLAPQAGPPPGYLITATPINGQISDTTCGTLTLSGDGTKNPTPNTCWK